ncbi:hypothetical protein VA7868_00813 [Vibrio aerogenes CECT 7868]|uniref:DUF3293 domain-containing protein n=1 Tax=Vibrio aerogenes CECT 7868 TaxID=1216006 RepID=A0A1M5WPF3_9VIBR|nr:DUF3293 domain-containing protein [Vibrio aerogenes]SHH89417.1 hypothetical protein VA7868_00813 [Vibrio aerogenes CECT 7868]
MKQMIDETLWAAYASSCFDFKSPIFARNFSIITAWNPESQQLPESENCANNKRLLEKICQYEWACVRVGDIQFKWIEESFAVAADLETSLQIAREFGQNAIYYVRQGQLFLYACVDVRVDHLGLLSEKIYKKLE